jgi:hypothetical protein
MLNPAGYIIIKDLQSDKVLLEADTLQCVHCGGHFPVRPGSGKIRGFCTRCNGPVCGPGCKECVPTEQYLENMEAGIINPDSHRPAKISTHGLILPEF